MRKRVFIDMDGTVARFHEQKNCLDACRFPGFYSRLRPYENMVEAVRILKGKAKEHDFSLCFLSAVSDSFAQEEKMDWADAQIGAEGGPIGFLFCSPGMDKACFVESYLDRPLTSGDVLLDDYSKHLVSWSKAGGTAVKCLNDINGRGWNGFNFRGVAVNYDDPPELIADAILYITGAV